MTDTLLKRAFLVDGIGSLASTAVLVADAEVLADPLGLSVGFLTTTGWLLLPVALLFFWIARTGTQSLAMIGIAGNVAWVLASVAAIPILAPTTLGAVVILVQAVLVAEIAWFEWRGLKRARASNVYV
jgi:hypothetical protein